MFVKKSFILTLLISFSSSVFVFGQVMNWDELHRGSLYFSIGLNKQWFANSTININQNYFNNNFNIQNISATDRASTNDFSTLTNYCYRFGYFFNYNQNAGVEIWYDPCKYYIPENQNIHISGTFDGDIIDNTVLIKKDNGYYYNLKEGLGVLGTSFVKRYGVYRKVSHKFALDVLGKVGMGAVVPKVEYDFGNNVKTSGMCFAGLAYNAELGVRWITQRHFFLELNYKCEFANLFNIQVFDGIASQKINSTKITLNLGYTFSVSKHNPIFAKGYPHRKKINNPKAMYNTEEDY